MNNLPAFVIVDGPRGAGKTTTASLIVDLLNVSGIRAKYFKKLERDPRDEYTNMVNHIAKFRATGEVVVCDRFVATEFVMSVAHNRADEPILTRECREIDRRLDELDVVHLILLPPLTVIAQRLAERGENGRSWDMEVELISPLWRKAHGLLKTSALFTNHDAKSQADILNYVRRRFGLPVASERMVSAS